MRARTIVVDANVIVVLHRHKTEQSKVIADEQIVKYNAGTHVVISHDTFHQIVQLAYVAFHRATDRHAETTMTRESIEGQETLCVVLRMILQHIIVTKSIQCAKLSNTIVGQRADMTTVIHGILHKLKKRFGGSSSAALLLQGSVLFFEEHA